MSISRQENTPCKKSNGFTLVELLVTIVIVGILASMATSAFDEYKRRANDAVAISALRNMITSFNVYLSDVGSMKNDPDININAFYSFGMGVNGVANIAPNIPNAQAKLLPGYIHPKNVGVFMNFTTEFYLAYASHCKGSLGAAGFYGEGNTVPRSFYLGSNTQLYSNFNGMNMAFDGSSCL